MLTQRLEEKGKPVKDAFPNVRLVIGDLDNSKILEEEAAKANVVIRESRSHTSS
jgi:hypothetical protein